MKIKQILLKNFATVDEVQIDLNDGITYLVGVNGSGKTMCGLNAIWFILEGIAKTGKKVLHADRFRFIGKYGKSAIGQITLYDEKENIEIYLQRKITKGTTSLKVKASDGRDLGDDFVDKIFNIFSINPEGFAQLTPKEQACVLGIDTGDIDHKKKMVYDERRELGYLVKQTDGALDGYKGVKKVKSVDVQELIKKKAGLEDKNQEENDKARILREDLYRKVVAHNKVQTDLQSGRGAICDKLTMYEEKIVLLDNELKEVRRRYVNSEKELAALPSADTLLSTDVPIPEHKQYGLSDIQGAIDKAQEQNKKAELWDKAEDARKQHSEAVNARDKKDQEYQILEQERVKYLKSCNLPFSNITINDNGELMVDGRPFASPYFSKGEILRAGIKMAAATMPALKYIFVPDAQSIDEANREILFKELTDAGFQVVAEMVGTEKKKGDNSILLKESRVVDSYEDTKNVL